jgi:hypothetical protein
MNNNDKPKPATTKPAQDPRDGTKTTNVPRETKPIPAAPPPTKDKK